MGNPILYPFRKTFGFLQDGQRIKPAGWVLRVIMVMGLGLTLFELWIGSIGTITPLQLAIIFTGLMYTVSFLTVSSGRNVDRIIWIDYLCSAASFLCGLYFTLNGTRYVEWVSGISDFTTIDALVACAFILLTLELMRRCVGFGLSVVVLAVLLYVFFGQYLSGTFSHRPIPLTFFAERMIIGIDGIFGTPTQVAATYAFLFVLFGKLLQEAGGGKFFFDLAAAVAGKRTGGPAKVSVVSSGLFGMISGSPVADVMTTGPVTIPMMKKMGYSAKFAGGVEAVASSGGSIMPPVMGAVVFLMAEFTGIRYVDIAIAAVFVALLYYFAVYMQVHFHAVKLGLHGLPKEQIVGIGQALKDGWHFSIPFIILIWGLLEGYTPSYVAVMAILSVIVVSWLKKETRLTPRKLVLTFAQTCYSTGPLVGAVAAAGIVIGGLNVTGLAGKFTTLIFAVTGESLFFALLVSMMVIVLLGMGMPTVSAYILGAVLVAPALIELGIPVLETHLFLVYYASMSSITPPVAVAAYAASSIAEDRPMGIAVQAVRLGIVAFIIPFILVYEPSLLLQGSWNVVLLSMVTAVIGTYFLACAMEGWMRRELGMLERILFFVAGILTIIPGWLTDVLGIVLASALIVAGSRWQRRQREPEIFDSPGLPEAQERSV